MRSVSGSTLGAAIVTDGDARYPFGLPFDYAQGMAQGRVPASTNSPVTDNLTGMAGEEKRLAKSVIPQH